jgi:hypothetical protein
MEKDKKIKSVIRQAAYESQAISEKVKRMQLPNNVESWISDAIDFANNLPDTLNQKPFILRHASFALDSINNEQKLKEHLFHIENNIDNAEHDLSLMKQYSGSKTGGSAEKVRYWAKSIADYLLNEYPKMTKDEIWDQIQESAGAEELEFEGFLYYRDGDDLVKTQHGIEKKLKKSTFFKNYLIKK